MASSNPIPTELSASSADGGISLIDLDESQSSNTPSQSSGPDDLAGLFALSGPPLHQQMPVMGGSHLSTYSPSPMSSNGNGYGMGMLMGGSPSFNNQTKPAIASPQASATPPASIMLPTTPATSPGPTPPNYFGNVGNVARGPVGIGSGMGMGSMTPQSSSSQTQQRQPPSAGTSPGPNQTQGKDPFADLAGLF